MLSRKRAFRAPFVVTTAAIAVACGGSTFEKDPGSGGSGNSGGSGTGASGGKSGSGTGGVGGVGPGGVGGSDGVGGSYGVGGSDGAGGTYGVGGAYGSGGTGGNIGCPPEPPPQTFAPCPPELAGVVCPYTLECQSGSYTFDFTCGGPAGSTWTINQNECGFEFDSCPGTDVMCRGGTWQIWQGTNPPPPCPDVKPKPGDHTCYQSFGGAATCGYRCEGGDGWTIGSCYGFVGGNGSWLYDGACAGDCSMKERAIDDYLQAHRSCNSDADCQIVYSSCAVTAQHCSGAFYVSKGIDMSEWNALNQTLSDCATSPDGAWSCTACNGIPPPPACSGGQCVPGQ
jgi:hypothetical protein